MNLLKEGLEKQIMFKTEETKQLTIDGHSEIYSVYKIKLDSLYYNDQNDRIATWIAKYKEDLKNLKKSNLIEYNNRIHLFITNSNEMALKKTQTNIKAIGQQEIGVILPDGRVIDGNRRFTCLRNIQKELGETQYFKAVIINKDISINLKEIKLLELFLQLGTDKIVEYNPIDRLIGIYNDLIDSKLLTKTEYAKATSMSEKDIEKEIKISELLIDFLEFINAPKKFHLARELNVDGPLRELYLILNKCKSDDIKEDIKNIVFSQMLSQSGTDMTREIRKIKKIAENTKYAKEYIKSNEDIIDEVCNLMVEDMEMENIKDIRKNDEVKSELSSSVEKYLAKVDGHITKNQPAAQIAKAILNIESIDLNIVERLSIENQDEIESKIEELEELIRGVKEKMSV